MISPKMSLHSIFYFLLIFFYSGSVHSSSLSLSSLSTLHSYDEVVSLGKSCEVATQLRLKGIRKNAYPFDWLVSPFDALESFIINEGVHFLDEDKLVFKEINPPNHPYYSVLDSYYGLESYHDFLGPDDIAQHDKVRAKFDRRKKRFFDLLRSDNRILLIRSGGTRQEAERLNNLLQMLYPNLDYTLLVVSYREEFQVPWKIPRIEIFTCLSIVYLGQEVTPAGKKSLASFILVLMFLESFLLVNSKN